MGIKAETALRTLISEKEYLLFKAAPDLLEAVKNLKKACISLMGEVMHRTAADWGLVNEAMMDGTESISKAKEKRRKENCQTNGILMEKMKQ